VIIFGMACRRHILIDEFRRDKGDAPDHQEPWIKRLVHTHGVNSIKVSKFENIEDLSEMRLVSSDSMKTNVKSSALN
jgi:hypothetical protein